MVVAVARVPAPVPPVPPVPAPAVAAAVVAAVVVEVVAVPAAPVAPAPVALVEEALVAPVPVAIEAALPAVARASLRRMAVEGMVHPILMACLIAPIPIHTIPVVLPVVVLPVTLPPVAALVALALPLVPRTQGTLPHPDRGLYIVPDLDIPSIHPSIHSIQKTPTETNYPQILLRRRTHSLLSRSSLTSRNHPIPPPRSSIGLLPRSLAIRRLRVSLYTPIPLCQQYQSPQRHHPRSLSM